MDSNYETLQDRGIGKKKKSFHNNFKRIFESLEVCSWAHKLQMCTLLDLACIDSSYETKQDRGIGKKWKVSKMISKEFVAH